MTPRQFSAWLVIPLDVEAPAYDLWKNRRDDLSVGREPGPSRTSRRSNECARSSSGRLPGA